jgi:hypothetical protein
MSREVAAIFGALGGAFIGVIGTLYTAHRRDKRNAKAAARLLLAEFVQAGRRIAFALDENDWDALASHPPRLLSWERVSQTVAGYVRPATWKTVRDAVQAVALVADVSGSVGGPRRIYPAVDPDAPDEADRTELLAAQREIEEAILDLARISKSQDEAREVEFAREVLREAQPDC